MTIGEMILEAMTKIELHRLTKVIVMVYSKNWMFQMYIIDIIVRYANDTVLCGIYVNIFKKIYEHFYTKFEEIIIILNNLNKLILQ